MARANATLVAVLSTNEGYHRDRPGPVTQASSTSINP
jgi:hypothetical protein